MALEHKPDRQRAFEHDMKNMLGIIIGYSNLLLDDLPDDDPRRTDLEEILKAGEGARSLLEKWSAPASGEEIS